MFRSRLNTYDAVLYWVSIFAMTAFLAGCGGNPARPHELDKKMQNSQAIDQTLGLLARVVMYKPNAMHDDFAGGASESYDLAVFEVQEPTAYQGTRLRVANRHVPGEEPIRVEVGKIYKITIAAHLLETPEAYLSPESLTLTPYESLD